MNECGAPANPTLDALKTDVSDDFYIPAPGSNDTRFHCYCRDSQFDLTEIHKGKRTSFRKLILDGKPTLLGLVHGADIRNYSLANRQSLIQRLANEMQLVKSQQENNRLILIGDFNVNPYDRSMNQADGLNAMMTRTCVSAGQRTLMGEQFDFYYNPMWSLFGDNSEGPPGTVFDRSSQGPYGWSMLDQVILNHSVVSCFDSVEILTHAGETCLTDGNGRPNADIASDHLPIMLELRGIQSV